MSAPLELARTHWRALWSGDDTPWADAGAVFLPFDRLATLADRTAIVAHWQRRRAEYRRVADEWTEVAAWELPTARVVIAAVDVDLEHGGAVERRRLTLAAAHTLAPAPRLLHLAEATPAALLLMLEGYEAEARADD